MRNTSAFAPHLSNRFAGLKIAAWLVGAVALTGLSVYALFMAFEASLEVNFSGMAIWWCVFAVCQTIFWGIAKRRASLRESGMTN